ncbi:MAG: hypothetical protein ABUS47_06305 [Steroidobacter sp.]
MIHDIDKQRFKYLLQCAVQPDMAKKFLRENRIALISANAPLDNVPSDPQTIYRIIEGFGVKANQLFGKWLEKEYKSENPLPIPQLILRWRGAEELGIVYDNSEKVSLSQQGLCALFAANPDEEWISFLRTPVPDRIEDRITINSNDWLKLTIALLTKDRAMVETTSWIDAAVEIVNAVSKFDGSTLSENNMYSPVLSEIRSAIESSRPVVVAPIPGLIVETQKGIQGRGPELRAFDANLDYTNFTVIATNRTQRDVDTFLLFVEGFVDENGHVFQLVEDDLKKAIPTIGRVILHPEQYSVRPHYGEPHVYEVETYPTENKAKVKATRRIHDALYPVVPMPHASADAHKIRDYITNYAKQHLNSNAVFISADKLCLMPRVTPLQKVLTPDFDWQLDAWDSLDAIEFQNGPYVLKLGLNAPTKSLNCESLSSAARKLLRIYNERSQTKLPRAARDQLIELVETNDFRFDETTKERLRANLNAISNGTEDFDQLIAALLQAPSVKDEVERRTNEEIDLKVSERDKTKRELEQLRAQRTQLERRIADLRSEAESEASAVGAAVQRAFLHARENGIETLAKMAVFDSLLKHETAVIQPQIISHSPATVDPQSNKLQIEVLEPSGKQVRDVFRRFGMDELLSERVAAVLELVRSGGSPIVVTGCGASSLGIALAQALSHEKCLGAKLPIGLSEDEYFGSLVHESKADVIVLRQANVCDLSLCARSLLDEVVARMMTQNDTPPFVIMMIDVGGSAALHWPPEIVESAVCIDLDTMQARLDDDTQLKSQRLGWLGRRLVDHYDRFVDDHPVSPETLRDLYRLLMTYASASST